MSSFDTLDTTSTNPSLTFKSFNIRGFQFSDKEAHVFYMWFCYRYLKPQCKEYQGNCKAYLGQGELVTIVEEWVANSIVPVLVARKIERRRLTCRVGFIRVRHLEDDARAFLVHGLFTMDLEACDEFDEEADVAMEGAVKLQYVGRADPSLFN